MIDSNFIKHGLRLRQLPIYEGDITYIQNLLYKIKQAEATTNAFPHLNAEIPITVVDKRLML